MKHSFLVTGIFTIALTAFSACSKEKCLTPPSAFQLRVENAQAEDLLNPSVCPTLKLVYTDTKTGTDVTLDVELRVKTETATDKNIYYLRSVDLPWKSLEGIKAFRLYRGNLNPDTLIVDVQKDVSEKCTSNPCKSVKFNSQEIIQEFDSSLGAYVAKVQ